MNKQRLTELVGTPRQVADKDLPDLKALAERYPWYSGAHMLLAIGELNSADVLADEHLSKAAAVLPDRSLLFMATQVSNKENTLASDMKLVSVPTPAAQVISRESEVAVAIDDIGSENDEDPQAIDQVDLSEALITEQPDTDSEPDRPRPTNQEIAERIMEQQMLQEAKAFGLDLLHPVAPSVQCEEDPSTHPDPSALSVMSFSSWLTHSDPVAPERTIADPKDLVDRFIQGSVGQPKVKTTFFSPVELGKRSLQDEQEGFITETLARIYEQQGDIPKAIDAYYRLALKIPSKSAYFAALAKKLEEDPNT